MFMNPMKPRQLSNNSGERELLPIDFNKVQDGTQKFEVRLTPTLDEEVSSFLPSNNYNNRSLEVSTGVKELKVKDNSNDQGLFSRSPFHYHDGIDQPFVQLQHLAGFVMELDISPPSHKPRNFFEQFVLIDNGGTDELWIYSVTKAMWIQIL